MHLGGNSMGGFVVTEYAVAHPGEVARLRLLAPAGTTAAFDSALTLAIENGGPNPLLSRTPEDFPHTMDLVMAQKPFMPYSIRRVLAERAAADYPLHARIFDEVGPGRIRSVDDRLRGLATPTLVVWGTADRALNPRAADVYRAAMPNAEVVLMPGIGHLPMLEAPEAAARDYLAFRDRLAAAPASR
jgi:pimeloyl-ACP methyl ester carboxylesterase